MKHVDQDGTRRIQSVFQPHENRMYVRQDSEEFEKTLTAQNAKLRQVEHSGLVRLHLQMSEQDYAELLAKYPLLLHGNTRQRRALWEKIAKERPDLVAAEFKPRLHPAR